MSDFQQGPDWWYASDGKWYPPPAPYQQPGPAASPTVRPFDYAPQYVPATTNGFAIASLVLGLVCLYGIGSVLAIVFGYRARREIDNSRGRQKGRGMATAGVVLGWIGIILVVFFIVVVVAAPDSSRGY